jgi:acyl-CoA dehydrogenase
MHSHLVAAQVWRHKHDLPAPVLSRVAAERLVLISTGAADWLASHGTASRTDGGYRVSARKSPSSGAPAGDVLVTSARWEDAPEGPQVIHFSVPFGAEGVSIEETWDTMGMRATGSHTVVLDDFFVPDAAVALTRPAGEWHPVFNTIIGAAMPLIMSSTPGSPRRQRNGRSSSPASGPTSPWRPPSSGGC